jgi:hypothetical protein
MFSAVAAEIAAEDDEDADADAVGAGGALMMPLLKRKPATLPYPRSVESVVAEPCR